jgi:DNA topoisomerase IA
MSESLRAYIASRGLDERLVMNELQEHRKCSDNAVWASDVGNGGECIGWLEKRDTRHLRANETARRAA